MKNKLALISMIFLFAMLTPVLAYTIGDDICTGLETQGWEYRFFNTAEINNDIYVFFNNETGTFEYTNWEVVDSSFNTDITDSAIHFFEFSETSEFLDDYDGYRVRINWYNDTDSFTDNFAEMNTFSLDFYNVSYTNIEQIYMITDFQYVNETEDKIYLERVQNNPVTDRYFLGEGDYQIKGIIDGLCDVRNLTTSELLEEDVACPNPMPIHSIDLVIFNELSSVQDDWSLEYTIDNFNLTYSETELNSPDCAIVFEDIDSLHSGLITQGYVNLTGTILDTQSRLDYGKLLYSRGIYDESNWLYIADSSSSLLVSVPIGCMEYMPDKSVSLLNHEINVVGWIDGILDAFPLEEGYTYISNCNNLVDLGISTDTPLLKTIPMYIYDTTEIFGDSYVLSLDSVQNEDIYYYRGYESYNSTHYAQTDMILDETTYVEINETRATDVGDYEVYRLLFYPYPEYWIFYSDSPFSEIWTTQETINFIVKGDGYANQCDLWDTACYAGLNPFFSEADIIGDGICGDLESSYPSDWNYSDDCRFAGMTGYAIAVQTQFSQMLLVMMGAFVIVVGILTLISADLTIGAILTGAFSIIVGIVMVIINLSLIITP